MGSPISGFIAEAVLRRLESLAFQHHRPKFWARYVDDTFVVIERDQVLTFKERLNGVFPDIQFTMEEEENNQLAFLDVLVCRKHYGGLMTKVFRKATNTTQILNFNSNHPISHKRSCVRTLYRRAETHCSEPEDKIAESQYLRRVFRENGYPHNFVNWCMRKRDERQNRADPKFWRAIPYIKNVSEAVSRLLAPLGVRIAHRLEVTMRRQVMRPKDPRPRQETSGVVYRIWCSCGQSNYVGETGRLLRTRIAEHVAAVRRNNANSQVAAHSTRPGHTNKFDQAEILARGDDRVSRELLESWFTGPRSINKCNDIPTPYSVLRHRLAKTIDHSGRAQAASPSKYPTYEAPAYELRKGEHTECTSVTYRAEDESKGSGCRLACARHRENLTENLTAYFFETPDKPCMPYTIFGRKYYSGNFERHVMCVKVCHFVGKGKLPHRTPGLLAASST
ncbi:hypothetical protein SprV_0602097800 [Sparganum proliferum]